MYLYFPDTPRIFTYLLMLEHACTQLDTFRDVLRFVSSAGYPNCYDNSAVLS
jgi:hypothetical protein